MYPRLIIDKEKYRHNVKEIQALCKSRGLSMMAVTKSFCADSELIKVLNEEFVDYIADSRIENLKTIDTPIKKVLLRLVSLHEVGDVIKHADISLNSELSVIQRLNEESKKHQTIHKVILMIDIGDLREGIYYKDELLPTVKEIEKMTNIDLMGIGTNLTCYGGVIPTEDTLQKLVKKVLEIEEAIKRPLAIVSGGNSSHLYMLNKDIHIPKINNLRIGEALILGRETAFGERLSNLYFDVVSLETDIIELKYKPSVPEGEVGMDAFGKVPSIRDYGYMKRGIIAIGKQDVDFHELIPLDKDIRLVGSSSDHIILDLTHTKKEYNVGDVLKFNLSYGSLLSLMTSHYVRRCYV